MNREAQRHEPGKGNQGRAQWLYQGSWGGEPDGPREVTLKEKEADLSAGLVAGGKLVKGKGPA